MSEPDRRSQGMTATERVILVVALACPIGKVLILAGVLGGSGWILGSSWLSNSWLIGAVLAAIILGVPVAIRRLRHHNRAAGACGARSARWTGGDARTQPDASVTKGGE